MNQLVTVDIRFSAAFGWILDAKLKQAPNLGAFSFPRRGRRRARRSGLLQSGPMALGFANLHTHSHFTLLDGVAQIPDLVKYAKAQGYKALGLADSGNLYGAIEFWNECRKKEIKPILGVDFYVAPRTRHDKEARIDSRRSRLILFAENETGWKNLLALVTYSHLEGLYYKPRIDRELMERYREGLVCVLPFWSGDVARALAVANKERALEFLDFYRKNYGEGNVFVEICTHPEMDSAAMRRGASTRQPSTWQTCARRRTNPSPPGRCCRPVPTWPSSPAQRLTL